MRIARTPRGGRAPTIALLLGIAASLVAGQTHADRVSVDIEGLQGEMLESVRASLELQQYSDREVSAAQVRRLFERADAQIKTALEPFGYYEAQVDSDLVRPEASVHRAVFRVTPGPPVIVSEARIEIGEEASKVEAVAAALAKFAPKQGERLDHAIYERSKQQIDAALANEGFLREKLVRHRVEVTRATRSASIDLEWDAGQRYRFGPAQFSESQFPDEFLQRFTTWKEGEFYSADKLQKLQQRLVNAEYFASVGVTPDLDQAKDGAVPIEVLLIPAKRTAYTANLYVSTDAGLGGRLAVERRWVNQRGHKLTADMEYSERLEQISTNYRVPRPGVRNRYFNFGAAYRDEETDTSRSRMARLAATEVTERWKGFTRTLALQYLNGNFEIADEKHDTNLLYADALLTRRKSDDPIFTERGYWLLYELRFSYESPVSDTTFVQARAEAKWVQQLGDDGRLILRSRLGAMTVDDFDALPPELRFFSGGDRSIRGFDYEEIGETNAEGGVIGGQYRIEGGVEYEHYFLEKWGASVFVDAGDSFTSAFSANVGAGIGLRWKSPVGLVRLDVAKPVVSDFDDEWRFHLVIGPDL